MHTPVVACIGLGGNLGDAAAAVASAARSLDGLPHTRLLQVSRLYRTPAWGVTAQPDFINAVAAVETSLAPRALLDGLLALERDHGRTRAADGSDRWGPRTLDLDILLYGDAVVDAPGLTIPHPRLSQRAFALLPLLEILPGARIPGVGDARAALAALETTAIEALG
ncbi:2-amino-4-hydroxy-6-hydroxymethyldihydropteridine diphosphokinase [Luteimonas aestuarii]|uniref:2-amino-4-hydroxy-6-hydroxymethyldihydropteridine pyrophosphokinase n=1 Tax=Luteimonas aestuarii TaxID=453837 RepID=A0A4R5U435_9GAMM|nr:2-amino-4-hydroxy-6-hydroxymethyldihydropteridine diphosphokinase [Luteimonas aestuarii]TDK28481.1 2-amino-4-hydroxy-6-hydroxymethyldihydropteridine diphosphokinase [Luteimonas aestuarii]